MMTEHCKFVNNHTLIKNLRDFEFEHHNLYPFTPSTNPKDLYPHPCS